MISAKRFITNKNTVTIIGVLIVLIILYWGYKSTIDSAVNPVKVPVASHLLNHKRKLRHQIFHGRMYQVLQKTMVS